MMSAELRRLKKAGRKILCGLHWLFSQDFLEERASLFRHHAEKNLHTLPQPVMLLHETGIVKERAKTTINLEIMGTKKSIAEALIIQTTISMLKDNGYKDLDNRNQYHRRQRINEQISPAN